MSEIIIDGRKIGPEHPLYMVAELSANHNGKLQKALDTITKAKACGADAVKLQTYTADTMTIDSDHEDFCIQGGLWDGYKLYDLYKEAETPFEWHKTMFDHARKIGITCFSTPFDETAVNLATAIKNCINPENNRNYSRNISNVKKKYSWSRFVKKINIS